MMSRWGWLLNSSNTNLTCSSSSEELERYFETITTCQLTPGEQYFEFVINFYVTLGLCLAGLILNTLNFKTFCKEHFDGPAYAYVAGISLVDALYLFFHLISTLTVLKCENKSLCKNEGIMMLRKVSAYTTVYLGMTFTNALQTISAWLTVLLGVERYLAMKYFHFRRTRCHKTDAKLTIVMLTFVGLVFNLPYSFMMSIQSDEGRSAENNGTVLSFQYTNFGKSYAYSIFAFFKLAGSTIIPCIVLVINNVCLLILVMNHNRSSNRSEQRFEVVRKTSNVLQASIKRIKDQKKLTMLLIIVIFVFLLGQIPRSLLFKDVFPFVYSGCPCGSRYLWICCPIFRKMRTVFEANYLLCLNANFLIYFGLNKHFRAHIVSDLFFLCVCSGNANETVPEELAVVRSPIISVTHPIRGSPPPSRRHSCVTFDTNSVCILSGHAVLTPANSYSKVHGRTGLGLSQGSTPTSTRSLFRSDDTFGPREEMDDLLYTTVMITKL